MDYLKLGGKSAIVTGGGRGIGRAIAIALAEFGAKVMICDINAENGSSAVKEITDKGGTAVFCPCNVAVLADVKKVVAETVKAFGKIDILVNNAGIGSHIRPFWTISYEEWDKMILVDLTSAFMFSMEAFPYMKEQNYGKIVNISSGAGVHGLAGNLHYSAAKAGMIGMTKAMAKESAPFKINVNAIAVGTTITPLGEETGTNNLDPSEIPWGRLGTTEDVANTVLYLASDASEYTTGQVLAPNGGRRT